MADKAVVTQTTLDAIGQAIIDKGGATEPMTPAQMPAAIQAIPSGGVDRPVYDPVKAAKGTAVEVHIEDNDLTYGFIGIIRDSGSSSYVVDWGDGSAPQTFTDSSTSFNKNQVSHSYSSAGDYIISVSDNCSRIRFGIYNTEHTVDDTAQWQQKTKLKITSVKRIGSKISTAEEMFRGCRNLKLFERWFPPTCSNMRACFRDCYTLKNFGDWPSQITGSVAECYSYCYSLTGSIPPWGANITNAHKCFFECYHLSGNIPVWGPSLTNVYETYSDCTNLSGVWSEMATDEELMPSSITTHGSAVGRCDASLRSYFKTDWGGTRSI